MSGMCMQGVCPRCGKTFEIETQYVGMKGRCPYCGEKFIISNDDVALRPVEDSVGIRNGSYSQSPYEIHRAPVIDYDNNNHFYQMSTPSEYRNFAWRRLTARCIDYLLGFICVSGALMAYVMFSKHATYAVSEAIVAIVELLYVYFGFSFFDWIVYCVFGNTPGKKLMGIAICDSNGNKISASGYFKRDLRLFGPALWLDIPIVSQIATIIMYLAVSKGKPARHDVGQDFQARPLRGKRPVYDFFMLICVWGILYFLYWFGNNNKGGSKNNENVSSESSQESASEVVKYKPNVPSESRSQSYTTRNIREEEQVTHLNDSRASSNGTQTSSVDEKPQINDGNPSYLDEFSNTGLLLLAKTRDILTRQDFMLDGWSTPDLEHMSRDELKEFINSRGFSFYLIQKWKTAMAQHTLDKTKPVDFSVFSVEELRKMRDGKLSMPTLSDLEVVDGSQNAKKNDPDINNMSREELKEFVDSNGDSFYNPKKWKARFNGKLIEEMKQYIAEDNLKSIRDTINRIVREHLSKYQNGEVELGEKFCEHLERAENGNVESMLWVALQHAEQKTVVRQDYKLAASWYRKAADAGSTKAMLKLASWSEQGIGMKVDMNQAVEWYKKAAYAKNSNAMLKLASWSEQGIGMNADLNQSVKWYRMAANVGNVDAMLKLAAWSEKGVGMKADIAQAVKWYGKAANAGNTSAMLKLAFWAEKGIGMQADDNEAIRWYTKAAKAGSGNAYYWLGIYYAKGEHGLEKSPVKASLMLQDAKRHGTTYKNVDEWLYRVVKDIR